MPLYDHACPACGTVFEDLAAVDEPNRPCPACAAPARRLPGCGRAWRADAPWLDSVTAVAEHGSDKPHVRAFLAHPDRTTYRAWMRGEGIRPLEDGENKRPARPDLAAVRREVLERRRARQART